MKTFKREYVIFDANIKTKEEAIDFIALKAEELGISNDKEKTKVDLWSREKECNTAIGDGIAIPHTKSQSIDIPVVLVIKPENIIDWDGERIKVIISFLTPIENKDNIHLTMLSKISRKLVKEDFKTTLKDSKDVELVYEMIMEALNS